MISKQPISKKQLDDGDLSRLIEHAKWNSPASGDMRHNKIQTSTLPGEVGMQLTNRCNLRCSHCFQWGDTGQYHELSKFMQNQELSFEIIEKIFEETHEVKSRFYVWGGEPLVYKEFDGLMSLLAKDPRWMVICTNGIGAEKKLDLIRPASKWITMLVSLDGFEEQNDMMRTGGAFKKTVSSIKALVSARNSGDFNGEVSVATVISDELIDHLFDFCKYAESLGINTLHINYPWHIAEGSVERMDQFYDQKFDWLRGEGLFDQTIKRSWHSYDYRINRSRADDLRKQLALIYEKEWSIRIKFQPSLKDNELENFLDGTENAPDGRKECISVRTRLSVLPSGAVTTCKLFPEFTVGDLNSSTISEIWKSARTERVREILGEGLSPVCSRCVQLYLNRPKTDILRQASA